MLLINTRKRVVGSYGDIGGILYGPRMRFTILASIVVSQIGFVCAYTIFTAKNLSAFVEAVTKGQRSVDVRVLIVAQLIILLPCGMSPLGGTEIAMIRDISKLSGTALIADFFILLGLCVLYYFDIFTLSTQGVSDIGYFNSQDYVLFLGTAAFAFEGIGLIIPIQESMIHPQKFKFVLTSVMIILILLFTSIGALSYAAYGSQVKTVIISSLPQDSGPPFPSYLTRSLRQRGPVLVLPCNIIVHPATTISRDPDPRVRHRPRPPQRKTKRVHKVEKESLPGDLRNYDGRNVCLGRQFPRTRCCFDRESYLVKTPVR
jgi:Transmembrane amino acid transporter protein